MSVQLQIEDMSDYLAARFTGAGATEEAWREFGLIAEHCKRTNKNKLLLDFAEARAEISLLDEYFLGEKAQIFAHYNYRLKVASLIRPDQADPEGFGEMVAQNRMVNVREFTSRWDCKSSRLLISLRRGIDL
jgi:hypothetical protein